MCVYLLISVKVYVVCVFSVCFGERKIRSENENEKETGCECDGEWVVGGNFTKLPFRF